MCINGDVVGSFWRASYQEEGDEIKSGVMAGRIRTDGRTAPFYGLLYNNQ